jgi:hypothetical protein
VIEYSKLLKWKILQLFDEMVDKDMVFGYDVKKIIEDIIGDVIQTWI